MFFLHIISLHRYRPSTREETYITRKADPIGMFLSARATEDLEGVVVWLLFRVLGLEV